MNAPTIDGSLFFQMFCAGTRHLRTHAKEINDLNVFPIPDGDTGDNMALTMQGGVESAAVLKDKKNLSVVSRQIADGMLLSARGNSGVILSQFFDGMAAGLSGLSETDADGITAALQTGVVHAYGAVLKPVEGTILTVAKEAAGSLQNRKSDSLEDLLNRFIREAEVSLSHTPEKLPVLKEAGVVDSGGAGFLYIWRGMQKGLSGEEGSLEAITSDKAAPAAVNLDLFTENDVLTYGYCTELLVRLQRTKTDPSHFDMKPLTDFLQSVGDSVVAFQTGSIVKIHVHTMTPDLVLGFCRRFGEFLTVKIENMSLQHNEAVSAGPSPLTARPHKAYGIVSVAAGQGIKDTLSSLGCDVVVDGGQSMNPSAEDLIRAFEQINADTILVFPNNSNITLTARQAASLYSGADVRVVPSKTVGEGYAAISMLDTGSGDTEAIIAELTEIMAGTVTGAVSKAVRTSDKDGLSVQPGDYIGFTDDTILVKAPDRNQALEALADKLSAGTYDIMLVLCGDAASAEETAALYDKLRAAYPRTEVIILDGGQPIYDYMLILE